MASTPQGPTDAEQRVLSVNDTFFSLLRAKPTEAKRLAYELEEVAQRYAPQPKRQTTKGQNQ